MRKFFRNEDGFNAMEIAALVLAGLVLYFLALPLLSGSGGKAAQDKAAQADLKTALTAVVAAAKGGSFASVTVGKSGQIQWSRSEVAPQSPPTNVVIGPASGVVAVVICNQSASLPYFCIKQAGKVASYGSSDSYYAASLTPNPGF